MASSANVAKLEMNDDNGSIRRLTHTQRAIMRLKKDYLTLTALGVLLLFVGLAVCAPLITTAMGVHPETEDLQKVLYGPDSENILGTDDKGRDHFSRLLYGAQISLSVAFSAAAAIVGESGVGQLILGISTSATVSPTAGGHSG